MARPGAIAPPRKTPSASTISSVSAVPQSAEMPGSGNSSALSCYNKISVDREFCLISAVEIKGTHGKCTAVKGEAGNEISRLIGVKDRLGLKYKFRP